MRNVLIRLLLHCLALGGIGSLCGCGDVIKNPAAEVKTSESRTSAHAGLEAATKGSTVTLLIKNEFVDPEILEDFRREFNYIAKPQFYDSDDDLHDALQKDPIDLAIVNGTELQSLIKANLLSPNILFLTNGLRMVENFLNRMPFDPKWQFSIPYAWTSFGTGYNMDFHTEPPESWKDLLDPDAIAGDLKGKIAMFNDPRYVIGSALIYLGYSPNSTNRTEIDQATALLLRQRPLVREDHNETNSREDLSGAHAFLDQSIGSDISVANAINKRIRFELPKEGTMIMVTYLAVPKRSDRQNIVAELIRFLSRPEVAGKNANYSHRASALSAALPYVDRGIRNGPAYSFPTESSRTYFVEDLNPEITAYYTKAWRSILKGEAKPTAP